MHAFKSNDMHQHMKNLAIAVLAFFVMTSCEKEDPTTITSDLTKLEQAFTETGQNAVGTTVIRNSSGRARFKIYYPANLSQGTPVITWGNGTNTQPEDYTNIHSHLASWGFIVIDNYERGTVKGDSILEAAKFMVRQNTNSNSIFYQKIDVNRIGAVGHSQGASGVVNAYANQAGGDIIKTIVPISLPRNGLVPSSPEKVRVPIFFITDTDDPYVSPLSVNRIAYDKLPSGVPAALALRKTADHEAIRLTTMQHGYVTAWLLFQLMNNSDAGKVFRGSTPELVTNPNWQDVSMKNIL